VPVGGGLRFQTISAGVERTCAVTTDAGIACWGLDLDPVTGADTLSHRHSAPVQLATKLRFRSVSVGADHVCALTDAGAAFCWGGNADGELGNGTTDRSSAPVAVSGDLTFIALQAGAGFTCGLTPEGLVWCWGRNDRGQLGSASVPGSTTPVRVETQLHFESLGVGQAHACAVSVEDRAYCWGDNQELQLGDSGGGASSPTPLPVSG
jgi:alpha-tubulin suppressor-like RCC1 family protein